MNHRPFSVSTLKDYRDPLWLAIHEIRVVGSSSIWALRMLNKPFPS